MSTEGDFPQEAAPDTPGAAVPPPAVTDDPADPVEEAPAPPRTRKAAPRKAAPRKRTPRAEPVRVSSSLDLVDEALVLPPPPPPPAAAVAAATPRRRGRLATVLVVLLTLILAGAAALGAAAWNESRPDVYQSRAVLLIDQEPAVTFAKDERLLVKLGALRVKFADQVRTTTFAQTLSGITGVPAGRIHGALSAQAPPLSLLLHVTARSTDADLPQPVADAAARELSQQLADEQARLGVPPRLRITLTLVSPAQRAALAEPSRRRSLELGLGAFGAVVLAAGLLYDLSRRRQPVAVRTA